GAPSELEAGLRNRLRDGGFTLGAGEGATIMTVRITMNNSALCDALPGTGSSYKCKTASRAAVVFSGGSMAKPVPPIDVIPRCGDPKTNLTYAQFGEYLADFILYTLSPEPKPKRPAAKC